jgi:hypothetical protein
MKTAFHRIAGLVVLLSSILACRFTQPNQVVSKSTSTPELFDLSSTQQATATAAPVPEKYQSLYASLNTNLDQASSTLVALPQSKSEDLVFASDLLPANSNRGAELLLPTTLNATRLYLDRLYGLGIRGVKIAVNYPLLTPAFPGFAKYSDFYRQVAAEVRQRSMVLTIQQSVIFANTPFSSASISYAGLTFERFESENLQMAQTIIDIMSPDHLILVSEPDTVASLTGLKVLNDPQHSLDYVRSILKGLNKRSTLVGAGSGTWSSTTFVKLFAAEPGIDFISLHMYPVTPAIMRQAFEMADLANAAAKPIVISEAWLYKTADLSVSQNVAASDEVFRLDSFDFFLPLDEKFIRLMVQFADVTHSSFLSFFWSNFFFGYLPYDPSLDSLTYEQLRLQANSISADNLKDNTPGSLGIFLRDLILSR